LSETPAKRPRVPGFRDGRRGAGRQAALRSALDRSLPFGALVLDLGGVVLPTLFEGNGNVLPLPGPFGEDPRYDAVERGELQERDYWRSLMARHPDIDVAALWKGAGAVRPEFERDLDKLQGQIKLAALTNDMGHWFGADWVSKFPAIGRFDHVVEASSLGALKPDPKVFTRLAEKIGEAPDRCIFVDDLPSNLAGAQAAGMAVSLFDVRDPSGSLRRLKQRIGHAR
jgi:beta-phosphoglucomutase-like phosphatase (HAD superfamily)